MRKSLDAKRKKVDMNFFVTEKCQHLRLSKMRKSSESFKKLRIFKWNSRHVEYRPVNLELKYDMKTVCSQPYPVPRVHESMFRKEPEKLVKLGVPVK